MIPDSARRRIKDLAASTDPLDREVGRRLAGRLPTPAHSMPQVDVASRIPSRWAHVDLADLLIHLGNPIQVVGDRLKAGHEPMHGSRSGSCLVAWPAEGRWWCSSCGRAGDAVSLVMQAHGVTYGQAADFLAGRYGPPRGIPASRAALRRRVLTGVVG
jgi:hypothetical protein